MIETTEDSTGNAQGQHRSQHLQRRIIRLLLQYDVPLFRRQFRFFFAKSALPHIPLLQQYDRYIKLQTLSNELLEAILPRIRRQLSLKTNHLRLLQHVGISTGHERLNAPGATHQVSCHNNLKPVFVNGAWKHRRMCSPLLSCWPIDGNSNKPWESFSKMKP